MSKYELHEQAALARLSGTAAEKLFEQMQEQTDKSLRRLKDGIDFHRAQGKALLLEELLNDIKAFALRPQR